MTALLCARNVRVEVAGRPLVDGVDLEVARGELVALAGPNGAGKTTLLRALAGEVELAAGDVELAGRPLARIGGDELALLRAVLPQETVLRFAFTVREVVEMGRHPHGTAVDDHSVDRALATADVSHLADRVFPSLSGGERALTSLARVLAQETPVLLLDEPTAALDLQHQELAMRVARDVADGGGAVVAVVHDLNLAAAYADRIALLSAGRLVACGTPWHTSTPQRVATVFRHPVVVTRSPCGDCPLVVPARF